MEQFKLRESDEFIQAWQGNPSAGLINGLSGRKEHALVLDLYAEKDTHWNDNNYSGGKEGSGQPALVYAAEVDLTSGKKEFTAKLIGHSSPDGSNGEIVTDTSSLTTALHIVKSITIHIQ